MKHFQADILEINRKE